MKKGSLSELLSAAYQNGNRYLALIGTTLKLACSDTPNIVVTRVHTKSLISNSRTFKNIFGGKTNLFKNISGASSAHFIYNTINRAVSSRETKSLTEVGAVKNVNNGYYRKNRHSVLLRGMLFNQEMNVQR